MSDLMKRLRSKHCCVYGCHCDEAADRIDQLGRELDSRRNIIIKMHDQLAAEKALADRLYVRWMSDGGLDFNPVAQDYRKARGL